MKVVNFLLATIAIIIALAAVGLSFRGIMMSRFAGSSWSSWAVSEQSDAVIVDAGGSMRGVTVCNRSFRRDEDRNAVVVETTTDGEISSHVLNYRSCISVTGALVEVKKPDGEAISARGRYKLDRGSRRGGYMRFRGRRGQNEEASDMTAPTDMTAPLDAPADGAGDAPDTGDEG